MCAQWGIMALLAAFAAALALATAADPTLALQTAGCPPPMQNCTAEPLCGSDGRTYATRCDFERSRCEGNFVEIRHAGPCTEPAQAAAGARCLLQRKQQSKQQPGSFVPECAPDGGFQLVQCHQLTGYCWCVDTQGRPLAGSSVHLQKPNCTTRRQGSFQRRASHQAQAKTGCSSVDRSQFNQNLVGIFQKEFDRLPKPPAANATGRVPAVLRWKFSELDMDNDEFLQLHEVRDLRRLARRIVEPQACARGLARYCDTNRDRLLSLSEWLHCLQGSPVRVDKGGNSEAAAVLAGALRPENPPAEDEDKDSQETQEPGGPWPVGAGEDCGVARRQAQEAQRDAPRIYVPECQPDGRTYVPAQCHGGLCWCVSVRTGRPLRGTTSTSRPDCATLLGDTFKGCPFRKKQLFLAALLHSFQREREQAGTSPPGSKTMGDDVLRWKFSTLDINHNQVLERKEWKQFRRGWASFLKNGGRKKLRKCWRNFLRFCDENDDSRISQDEWLKCGKPVADSARPSSGTRKGPNPFSTILISR